MTTLVPLLLGCSGFALGASRFPGVVRLLALGDIRVRWDGLPLIVGFVCCWSATGDCSWPVGLALLLLSVCAASAYRVLSRIFCSGGKSILKKIFEPRGGEKNFFRPSRGSVGMLPRKILKI